MADAGVVAVLLPATRFFLLAERYADARRMHELGVPVALGSDHSPTAPTESLLFVIGLACAELRMSPAEALVAATRNAAASLGRGEQVGALAPGMQADLLVLDVESYQYIPYHMTRPIVRRVVKRGVAVSAGAADRRAST
jgi:imidazolonepropionase